MQILDARQRDHMSRHVDLMMAGATWRDPDCIEEWIAELKADTPVIVYCSYGFDVGRNVTKRSSSVASTRASSAAASPPGTPPAARALKPAVG